MSNIQNYALMLDIEIFNVRTQFKTFSIKSKTKFHSHIFCIRNESPYFQNKNLCLMLICMFIENFINIVLCVVEIFLKCNKNCPRLNYSNTIIQQYNV